MDKAIETIKINCKQGNTTLVLTENGEFLFRAYETARLFGFRDARECIRNYSQNTRLVIMETAGGHQSVNCIPIGDVTCIAEKSRISEAREIMYILHIAQRDMEIKTLKIQNFLLADDFKCISDDLRNVRGQIDSIISDFGIDG